MASFGFDLTGVKPAENKFGLIEKGEYNALIKEIEMRDTKAGGKYISVELKIVGPKFKDRVLFDNINVVNASLKAQEIGRETLAAMCIAVGADLANPSSEALKGKIVGIFINKKMDNYKGEEVNKVSSYFKAKETVQQKPQTPNSVFSGQEIPF